MDKRLSAEFPSYSELASVRPEPLGSVQASLAAGEMMLAMLVGETRTFVWAVTGEAAQLYRVERGAEDLIETVTVLRQSLEPDQALHGDRLRAFPVDIGHQLYRDLIGPAEDLVAQAGHLIFVPDGALQSLPPAVLVTRTVATAPVTVAEHRNVDWLGVAKATSLLPSVSSLGILRSGLGGKRSAEKPFIGFGDPRLKRQIRKAARASRPSKTVSPGLFAPGGEAWREALSQFAELPDTADELRHIARLLKAPEGDVFLRDRVTEGFVREQDLERYRVVQFATHGLMAGDFQGLLEPALVMTPPLYLIPSDDGLLTASEITQLRLDADWVILSACNTAADDGTPGAEGLSGLAKAFFFAGGRTLLVSHWEVASETAVALTTGLFEALAKDPGIGRAEAFRRSIAAIVRDGDTARFAHPLFWAPFTVVGEGGAGQPITN